MSTKEFLQLQIGTFITDHQDTTAPDNYCMITGFKDGKICLQSYDNHGRPTNTHTFTVDYHEVNITNRLTDSDYYALSHRFV